MIDYKTYVNRSNLIAMAMQGKHAVIGGNEALDEITKFINQRYSIQFYLSKKKAFLSFLAFAMRKSLDDQITNKINQM